MYNLLKLIDKCLIKFEKWETEGIERYRLFVPMHYRDTGAVIIVYDITSKQSFESVKMWINELRDQNNGNIIILIVRNKHLDGNGRCTDKQNVME